MSDPKSYFPSDKILFGQYLVDHKKVTAEMLQKALDLQEKESTDSPSLAASHRHLGHILLEDFGAFKDRLDLNSWVQSFKDYRAEFECTFFTARRFGKKN